MSHSIIGHARIPWVLWTTLCGDVFDGWGYVLPLAVRSAIITISIYGWGLKAIAQISVPEWENVTTPTTDHSILLCTGMTTSLAPNWTPLWRREW